MNQALRWNLRIYMSREQHRLLSDQMKILGVTVSADGPVDIVGNPVNINQEKGGVVNIK